MLEDLSQHVLDISENSVAAGATTVLIEIDENVRENMLVMLIEDNGRGMTKEFVERVTDPFVTSRTTRRVGMGLPFLKQSAELCDGYFSIVSEPNIGTRTEAGFCYDSIDRPPLGDMPATVMTIFMGYPDIDWTYRHKYNGREFSISIPELVEALEDRELIRTTDVGLWIRDLVTESLTELRASE